MQWDQLNQRSLNTDRSAFTLYPSWTVVYRRSSRLSCPINSYSRAFFLIRERLLCLCVCVMCLGLSWPPANDVILYSVIMGACLTARSNLGSWWYPERQAAPPDNSNSLTGPRSLTRVHWLPCLAVWRMFRQTLRATVCTKVTVLRGPWTTLAFLLSPWTVGSP